jgi:hypothetical protein
MVRAGLSSMIAVLVKILHSEENVNNNNGEPFEKVDF